MKAKILLFLIILVTLVTVVASVGPVFASAPTIKVWGFTSPRNRAPLLDPAGNPVAGFVGASNLINDLQNPSNFGPGGVVPATVQFVTPFVTTIAPGSLVNGLGNRTCDVFFAGLTATSLNANEVNELVAFLNAGGVVYISGNSGGNEGPSYNPLLAVISSANFPGSLTSANGQTFIPSVTPITNGPFGVVGFLQHTMYRDIIPGSPIQGVAMGSASSTYVLAEGSIGLGYISVTGDPMYMNLFWGDPDNPRYFLNLFALAYTKIVPENGLVEVGGEVYNVDKLAILAPWITLAAVIVLGFIIAVNRRRVRS